MQSRRRFLMVSTLAAAATPASAQRDEAPRRAILDANRALQAGNASLFMSYFDKEKFAEFDALRRAVTALTATRTTASSIDILSLTEDDKGWRTEVDWLLQLTPISGPGTVETRQEEVSMSLIQDAKQRWRITSLEPVGLFRVL